jgi:hypothetical protein
LNCIVGLTFVIILATRTLIFAVLIPLVSAPCLCPLSIHPVSFPELNWSRSICVNPLLSLGYGFGYVMNCPKNRLRYHILPPIHKAIRTMNFISLLNSLSGYLLTICRLSASIRFLLPLYFIIPVTYIIDRTQNLEKAAEKLPSCCNKDTKDIKIKNCIGFTQVPLGLAGLLTIHRELKRTVYASLATVKPTLVTSCF